MELGNNACTRPYTKVRFFLNKVSSIFPLRLKMVKSGVRKLHQHNLCAVPQRGDPPSLRAAVCIKLNY